MEQKTESRVIPTYRYNEESRTVEGYAATFEPYDMGFFVEQVARDAFGDVSQYDVRALYNHDANQVLARSNKGAGTLHLEVDDKGLKYRFELPNTTIGNDIHEMLQRGDISQSSWGFSIESDTWEHGTPEKRTINKVSNIFDVSLVTYPANPDTSVALRSLNTSKSKNPNKMENQTAETAKDTANDAVRSTNMVDSSAISKGISTQEKRDFAKFNIIDAVNFARGEHRGGLVAELHQEAERESNVAREGKRFTFPKAFMQELRSHSATGQTTNPGDQGGKTIQTSLGQLIGVLTPDTVVSSLGATFMSNLDGNIDFPVENNRPGAPDMLTETGASQEKSVTFSSKEIRPKRMAAHMVTTNQLLAQSSIDVQNWIINSLNRETSLKLDSLAINGDGNPVSGVITSGTDITSIDTGAGLTFDNLIEMEKTLREANVKGGIKYLLTYALQATLKNTKIDAGSGRMCLEGMLSPNQMANGFEAYGSNLVPSSYIILGNWADLIVAEWGAPSILVDPYTAAGTSQTKIYVERFIDVLVRRAESFVYAFDRP